jgi:hypothetical protein
MAFAHTALIVPKVTVAPPLARVGDTAEFALCVAFVGLTSRLSYA